jgi:hypothetical protein
MVMRAIEDLDANPVQLSFQDLSPVPIYPVWHTFVYDLYPYRREAVEWLGRFRQVHPVVPILLYVPIVPDVEALAGAARELPAIQIKMQFRDSSEPPRFREALGAAIADVPTQRLNLLLHLLLGSPPQLAESFMAESLHQLCSHSWSQPTVRRVARELNVVSRTLERAMRNAGLPPPKLFLEWLTLLWLTLAASCFQTSTAAVAKTVGLDSNDLYRLRTRLLEGRSRAERIDSRQEFDLAFLQFAATCSVSRKVAEEILQHHVA